MPRITNTIQVRRDFWGSSSPMPCSKLISPQLLLQSWSTPTSCRFSLAKIYFGSAILTLKISIIHSFCASPNLYWYQLQYHLPVTAGLTILEIAIRKTAHYSTFLSHSISDPQILLFTMATNNSNNRSCPFFFFFLSLFDEKFLARTFKIFENYFPVSLLTPLL